MRLHWTLHAIRLTESTGRETLFTISDDGEVRCFAPATGVDVPIVDQRFRPLKSAPLRCAADAWALIDRIGETRGEHA